MGVDKTQNRKKKTALVYGVNFLLTALLFLLFTVLISSGSLSRLQSNLVILVCINVLMAVSLNLVTGVLGQLVLGHAGFMLVGAYTAALFTKSSGLPLEVALPIGLLLAGLVAAVFSVVIGIPALRLRGIIWRSSPWGLAKSSGWWPTTWISLAAPRACPVFLPPIS